MEVLDSSSDDAVPAPRRVRGWVAGGVAVALVVAGAASLRPPGPAEGVDLALVEHSGSALTGQQFLRVFFSVSASGGAADVERVEMVLAGTRQDVVPPGRIGDGGSAVVLVDVVPSCPDAVRELPAGTLEVTYRVDGDERVARLPLPVTGSLPRLVSRRCAALSAAPADPAGAPVAPF